MARSVSNDPLLTHNFALFDIPVVGPTPFAFPFQNGFTSGSYVSCRDISIPEMTAGSKDITEGTWPFVHKVHTGYTTTGDATIQWAVMPTGLDMWKWLNAVIWGRNVGRRDIGVVQLRQDKGDPQRMLVLKGCWPTSWKPTSDLSALGSEVAIEELTLSVNRVLVWPISPAPLPTQIPNLPSIPRLPSLPF